MMTSSFLEPIIIAIDIHFLLKKTKKDLFRSPSTNIKTQKTKFVVLLDWSRVETCEPSFHVYTNRFHLVVNCIIAHALLHLGYVYR